MAEDRRIEGDDLDRRIATAEANREAKLPASERKAESRGWAVGIEFVGAILVGAFLGWLLDRWLGTAPWLMIVFLALGFGAGLRRAMATSRQFNTNPSNDKH